MISGSRNVEGVRRATYARRLRTEEEAGGGWYRDELSQLRV
jgi:hypothetical protein